MPISGYSASSFVDLFNCFGAFVDKPFAFFVVVLVLSLLNYSVGMLVATESVFYAC